MLRFQKKKKIKEFCVDKQCVAQLDPFFFGALKHIPCEFVKMKTKLQWRPQVVGASQSLKHPPEKAATQQRPCLLHMAGLTNPIVTHMMSPYA